jgi:hypothetical protein
VNNVVAVGVGRLRGHSSTVPRSARPMTA